MWKLFSNFARKLLLNKKDEIQFQGNRAEVAAEMG